MKSMDLPPLPSVDASGPDVCNSVSLYLAVWDDLSDEQKQRVSAHIVSCPDCAAEQRLFERATRQMAGLAASSPSPRVDQAVLAAISARSRGAAAPVTRFSSRRARRSPRRLITEVVALAAVFMLALLGASQLLTQWVQPQFALPPSLSWNGYVLYHTQTEVSAKGEKMLVTSYYDLGSGSMNVETKMDNKLDIVAVTDNKKVLGMDMMNHVAEWDAHEWIAEEPTFNLAQLRKDLTSGHAVYLGKSTFNGKPVYRVRNADGTVLLLDMDYMPVNVLESSGTPGTAKPMFDTFKVLPTQRVPDSTWDMTVPSGFKLGTMPERP
jgi:hypothetical protein